MSVSLISKIKNNKIHTIKQLWIEPSGFCNLGCIMCDGNPRKKIFTKKTGFLSLRDFKKIIQEFIKFSCELKRVDFRGTGEPLMNPALIGMIKYCHKHNLMSGITTNGVLLTEKTGENLLKSRLTTLTFSIESIVDYIYEKIRFGARLVNVKNNIEAFAELNNYYKNKCLLQFNVVLLAANINYIEEIIEYAGLLDIKNVSLLNLENNLLKEKGTIIKDKKIYNLSYHELETKIKKWKDVSKKYSVNLYLPPFKPLKDKKCPFDWRAPIITCDGFVLPCCRMQEIRYSFGNILEKRFSEIWKTTEYNNFRKGKYKFCNICLKYLDRFENMYWLKN